MSYSNSTDFAMGVMNVAIDRNGAVKPNLRALNSGNGLLYTSMSLALCKEHFGTNHPMLSTTWGSLLALCLNGGDLIRTPDQQYGPESWDDYLGVAVASILIGDTYTPRTILWYGIKHFGRYSTSSFIGFFFQVWLLMWCAAFPWLKWPLYLPIKAVGAFMNPGTADASGLNLIYMYMSANVALYEDRSLSKLRTNFHEYSLVWPFSLYFGADHPFTLLEKKDG